MDRPPLLAFSNVRWESSFQRQHQVMTHMGIRRNVVFVEEPIVGASSSWMESLRVAPGVRVCRPHLAPRDSTIADEQLYDLDAMLRSFMDRENITDHAAWLNSPSAVKLARGLEPRAIIYDCTDAVGGFSDAPSSDERELLACADAVLTSGPSIFRARSDNHPFVRCFPNSVDVSQFAAAREGPEPTDQYALPRPRIGYHGPVDARLDFEILDRMAIVHPEWEIVLAGPAVGIDPSDIPQHANLRHFEHVGHAEVPRYMSGWDLCIVPFVSDESTRFANPTQVLEGLAGDRPVVCTPIPDVIELHQDIVYLGAGPEGFIAAAEDALGASPAERDARRARAARQLKRSSWDETVRRMDEILHYLGDFGRARESMLQTRAPWTYEARVS